MVNGIFHYHLNLHLHIVEEALKLFVVKHLGQKEISKQATKGKIANKAMPMQVFWRDIFAEKSGYQIVLHLTKPVILAFFFACLRVIFV